MPHVKDIIYYCIDFVNRFFTKNVIFLRDIYQSNRAWKPALTNSAYVYLLGIYNSDADGAGACVSAYNRADEVAIARS